MARPTAEGTPKSGDTIYVPSVYYISRGRDDVCGGRATIQRVEHKYGSLWIYVKEVRGKGYNWDVLGAQQEKLAAEYGDRIAHRCPDEDPSANGGWL